MISKNIRNTSIKTDTSKIYELSQLENKEAEPGIYVSYTTFHIPRSDKTEEQYEDAVWPRESYPSPQEYRKINGIFRIAGADGVSVASRYTYLWSRLLTEAYCLEGIGFLNKIPELSQKWEDAAIKIVKAAYLPNDMAMYRRDKAEINAKGASTTFAGAEIDSKFGSIQFDCIGDSCFFLIREQLMGTKVSNLQLKKHAIFQVPDLNTPDQFTNRPPQIHNTTEKQGYPMNGVGTIIQNNDIVIFATDAVAQWLVLEEDDANLDNKLAKLLLIKTQEEFEQFIVDLRKSIPHLKDTEKKQWPVSMHDDDSTISILRIKVIEENKDSL